ncbi:hypothetical protein D3C72_1450720 [compost metagenome]
MGELFRRAVFDQAGEVEPDRRDDVGDGEAVGGDELMLGQLAVQQAHELLGADAAVFGHLRLRGFQRGQGRVAEADVQHHRIGQVDLAAAGPHLDQRLLLRIVAEQVGLWIQGLQIAADGDGFRDAGPVVQFQRRDVGHADLGAVVRRAVLTGQQVDLDEVDVVDALLGHDPADPARIGRAMRGVELHRTVPLSS